MTVSEAVAWREKVAEDLAYSEKLLLTGRENAADRHRLESKIEIRKNFIERLEDALERAEKVAA